VCSSKTIWIQKKRGAEPRDDEKDRERKRERERERESTEIMGWMDQYDVNGWMYVGWMDRNMLFFIG
jgi:hypothetical protein